MRMLYHAVRVGFFRQRLTIGDSVGSDAARWHSQLPVGIHMTHAVAAAIADTRPLEPS